MTLPRIHVCRRGVLLGLAGGIALAGFSVTRAGQDPQWRLIMVEEAGCRFCQRWDREVGFNYAKTAEGLLAPLLRVKREANELAELKPVIYTPTFILARDGHEAGRISGYPGESFFWEELAELMRAAGLDIARERTAQ